MLNRKLLEVLKLLNAPERARLRLFLQSPYFNNRSNAPELLRLHDHIMQHDAEEAVEALSKANVAQLFFPNKPYKEGQKGPLDGLASDLFNLIKQFLAQIAFEKKDYDFEENLTMARFYRKYGMEERFWQVIQALRKIQQDSIIRDAEFFQKQFVLEEEAASFESLNNSFEDDVNLAVAIQNLDIAYLINKIELMCALSYQQKLSQQVEFDLNTPLSQAALSYPKGYPQVRQYDINHLVLQLIQDPNNDAAFTDFATLLDTHRKQIPFDKLRNLKAFYRYFWHRRYAQSGGAHVRDQMFLVYKEHYEQGYFYEGEAIMINSLKVLVLFGLKLNQFDWVKQVLDEHPPSKICGTKHPVEAHSLCLAEYYFYIKEYSTAVETLIYKHFDNPNFSLWAEMLLIKIYYETADDLLEYRMKALDQKVRRTKLSTETKAGYYQFIQKLDKIIKYGWVKDNPKRSKLLEEIKTTPGILDREWLLEKLEARG